MSRDPEFYVVVGPVRAEGVMATQPDIIHGFPMPTAVAGFGYKMALDISRLVPGPSVVHLGTAVIVHEHEIIESHAKHPAPGRDGTKGAPIVDEMRGRGVFTFVTAFRVDTDDGEMAEAVKVRAQNAVEPLVAGMFFGGGKVFPEPGKHLVAVLEPKAVSKHFATSKPGYVLIDRSEMLAEHRKNFGGDMLDALLDIVTVTVERDSDGKAIKWTRPYNGWLVPLAAGFQAIERPTARPGTRLGGVARHAYAESLYSVGEYRPLGSLLRDQGDDAFEGALWRHCYNRETETYFVTAN